MSERQSDEHIKELIVRAGKRLDVVMNDDRIRHVGSDPAFLATHDAMNHLASVLAILNERKEDRAEARS